MICQKCQKISHKLFQPPFYGHPRQAKTHQLYKGSDSLRSLRDSSAQGCELCALLYDAVAPRRSDGKLSEGTDGISLLSTWDDPKSRFGLLTVLYGKKHGQVRYTLEHYPEQGGSNQGLSVASKADDPLNLSKINSWLDECGKDHYRCHPDGDHVVEAGNPLPTRLIDTKAFDVSGGVRLILTEGWVEAMVNNRRASYAALSHCWGKVTDYMPKTTMANLKHMREGIPWDSLPKTFQDAITIAREINIRYLWSDALCIVQDDCNDVAIECSRMHFVYSMAFCTIAAADAKDGREGCFLPRDRIQPNRVLSCVTAAKIKDDSGSRIAQVVIYSPLGDWYHSITGVLNTREWCRAIEEYSARNLTNKEDRLPAISGLAQVVKTQLRDQYLAGLWAGDVPRGLCWFPSFKHRKPFLDSIAGTDFLIPSWSWARQGSPVQYYGLDSFQPEGASFSGTLLDLRKLRLGLPLKNFPAEVVGFNVDLRSPDIFGLVEGGALALRSYAIQTTVPEARYLPKIRRGDGQGPKCYALFQVPVFTLKFLKKRKDADGIIYFDSDSDRGDGWDNVVFCVRLGTGRGIVCPEVVDRGLVLISVEPGNPSARWIRVGMFEVGVNCKRWLKDARQTTVTMV
ncbi:hypothetical protein V493_08208 [Pseudogymnoascus sp. VKM F-4281 (FW-2241)]|nr:hypothetical protein V493_08208 [Pseudogymnoascus sp. VKM F-4281 (FW-2241)]